MTTFSFFFFPLHSRKRRQLRDCQHSLLCLWATDSCHRGWAHSQAFISPLCQSLTWTQIPAPTSRLLVLTSLTFSRFSTDQPSTFLSKLALKRHCFPLASRSLQVQEENLSRVTLSSCEFAFGAVMSVWDMNIWRSGGGGGLLLPSVYPTGVTSPGLKWASPSGSSAAAAHRLFMRPGVAY